MISGAGVGVDNIDISSATRKGIAVLHAPKVNSNATAEHAVALMFSLMKKLPFFQSEMREGNFFSRNDSFPLELRGRQIGLIGWGSIARRVAEICSIGLGMEVTSYVRSLSKEKVRAAELNNVKLSTSLDNVLMDKDVISVHIPLNKDTEKLINHRQFSIMEQNSLFINTSRGGVVHEGDLYQALLSKDIAGAGLDVFDPEPPSSANPLFKLSNVILTPHVGGISKEAARKSSKVVAENIVQFLKDGKAENIVNPEVLTKGSYYV